MKRSKARRESVKRNGVNFRIFKIFNMSIDLIDALPLIALIFIISLIHSGVPNGVPIHGTNLHLQGDRVCRTKLSLISSSPHLLI